MLQLQPWNVDTISQPGFEKTVSRDYDERIMWFLLSQIINKSDKKKEELTEDQKFEKTVSNIVSLGVHNIICLFYCACVCSGVDMYKLTRTFYKLYFR